MNVMSLCIPMEARRGHQSPCSCNSVSLLTEALGTELRPSGRATSTLNH